MDLPGILSSIARVHTKLEHVQKQSPNPPVWIESQLQTLERGLNWVQEWIRTVDATSNQLLFASLQDVFDTLDASLERSLELWRPSTPDSTSRNQSESSDNDRVGTRLSSENGRSPLEKLHNVLKGCVALLEFALAVFHSVNGNDSSQEVRELAVGSRILKENLSCSRRESRALWDEQKSQTEQYISSSYEAFIDKVIATDEDSSDDSTSDVTVRRASSRASSLETDFSTVIARGADQYVAPDELHLPESSASASNLDQRKELSTEKIPVIIPYHNGGMAGAPKELQAISHQRPKIKASASVPLMSSNSQLKRKPIARHSLAENPSVVSLSSSSSSSAAEKAINIASEMSAQSPSCTVDYSRRGYSTDLRRLSEQDYLSTARNSLFQEKYSDSPPPYISRTLEPIATPAVARPSVNESKRRENSTISRAPFIINLVREHQISTLRSLPSEGLNVDEADPATGRTALMEAALCRQQTISQILISSGSRLHLKDTEGNTALHFAAAQGDATNCHILLDAGAQIDEWNKRGETPLQIAAAGGHTEAVVCLLQSWKKIKDDDPGLSKGFCEASKSGNVSTAQAFLDAGMRPKKIKESWKPIAYAAQSGSIPMIDFMVSQKLSLKERSPDGWTALHFAARYGHTSMVEMLLASKLSWKAQTKRTGETALHLAIAAGHTSTTAFLVLHKDANVNMTDAAGQEPIHLAVRNGDLNLTTTLLSQGARLSTPNKYGWKLIHIATAYGHLALVADFMTRGVSIEEKLGSPSFKPSKHTNQAARKGCWAEIRWPHPGARPLDLALEFGHDELANMLIQGGAQLKEGDGEGWQPLHYAAFNCRLNMVNALLGRGASSHATTNDGNTPLSLGFRGPGLAASEEDKQQVCDILQFAMDSHKKSKFKQITSFMNTNGKSKSAAERNKVWHTAELAAALYQEETSDEGDADDEPGGAGNSHAHLFELEDNWEGQSGMSRVSSTPSNN